MTRMNWPPARRGTARGWRATLVLAGLLAGVLAGWLPAAGVARAASGDCVTTATAVTCTYTFTGGEQQFVVPPGVTTIHVAATGAPGAQGFRTSSNTSNSGGRGAVVAADLALSPGQSLVVLVGGPPTVVSPTCYPGIACVGGFNGGGTSNTGGGGGGASDVRTISGDLASRLLVAGGGGGGGDDWFCGENPAGGQGGDAGGTGGTGSGCGGTSTGGGGGTAAAGGAGGNPGGAAGTLGIGGNSRQGGGGGGGRYGGGGGGNLGFGTQDLTPAGGGGGGSNLVPVGGTVALDGARVPQVVITYALSAQAIAFPQPPDRTYGDAPFAVSAIGGASGNPVTFASTTTAVCTVGAPTTATSATVTLLAAGTCTVTASQAGDATYAAAPDVTRTFAIGKASQAITFDTPAGSPAYTVGDTFAVGATASSGLPVTFAASGPCTVSGTTVTVTAPGDCVVTASQAGNADYLAAPDVARTFPISAVPQVTVTASAQGDGTVSPAGQTGYAPGTFAIYVATPAVGQVFLGWTLDGQHVGFASPLTFTVAADRTLVARFAARPSFSDVAGGSPAWEAITQLAARGVIHGYSAGECAARALAVPCYGPGDPVLRAQMAALIVRSFGWDAEHPSGPAPFSDVGGVDPELQRAIAILAQRGIINGYGDGRFGPTDQVLHAQVVSFIARSMVQAGYWTAVTQDTPGVYPNVPLRSGHRLDLLTFVQNAGALPERPAGQDWGDWDTPASRGWTARVLWQALASQFGVDRVP